MLKNIRIDDERATFELEGFTDAFANALRRCMIADIPTVAIDEVHIKENNSSVADEYLSHRLGLFPIREGCKDAILCAKGPSEIYSDKLVDSDGTRVCIDEDILILKLLEGQNINLTVKARTSTGREHAKWSPVVAASYKHFTRGVTHPECFCEKTPWDEKCDDCGKKKRNVAFKESARCHRFTFSTISTLSPADVLSRTLQVLKHQVSRIEGEAANLMH